MTNKYCSNCGAPIENGSVVCKQCGYPVEENPSVNQPYSYYNQSYIAPSNYNQDLNKPMSVGQFVGTLLLSAIPIAGLILLLIWAFSSDTNINKKNFSRATLLISLVAFGVYIVVLFIVGLVSIISL